MDLPVSNFTFETTRKKNFENIFKIVNVKLYFHHSHVTGKVYGCAYDLFNWKVRGIQMGFFCIAYNLSGFDFFFLSKWIKLSCWETEDVNIRGANLANTNFVTICSQVKFIDTKKYFQTSLAQLASTLTKETLKYKKHFFSIQENVVLQVHWAAVHKEIFRK